MKLWPREQNLQGNIFKSKPHPSVAFANAEMTRFEMWSDFTDHFFGFLKQLFSLSG